MRVVLIVCIATSLTGCWDVNSTRCGDQNCPVDTTCFAAEEICVAPDRLCGEIDDAPCLFGEQNESSGLCIDGLCRPFQCKAPIAAGREITLDPGEECEVGFVATCLDEGFDRGFLACNDQCQIDASGCGQIGWSTQIRGSGAIIRSLAETSEFTLVTGIGFTAVPALRRDPGEELFEFIDTTGLGEPMPTIVDTVNDGDQVLAVGTFGLISSYDGSGWQAERLGTGWFGVDAFGDFAIAVGVSTEYARRVAGSWQSDRVSLDDDRVFTDVVLESNNSGIAVGAGIVARFEDANRPEPAVWTEIDTTPTIVPNQALITPKDGGGYYIAGTNGFVGELVGSTLVEIATGLTSNTFFSMERVGRELFLASDGGELWRYDGDSFLNISPVEDALGMVGNTSRGLIAGSGDAIHDYRGLAWAKHEAPPTGNLIDVMALHSGALLIGRQREVFGPPLKVLQFDGQRFVTVDDTTPVVQARAVWARGNETYAAQNTTLYQLIATTWVELGEFPQPIADITGDSTRLFVVGDAGMVVEVGVGPVAVGSANIHAGFAVEGGPLYVVGADGFFARIDGTNVSIIETDPAIGLNGVYAAAADHAVVVGDLGAVFHFDGVLARRAEVAAPLTQPLTAVHGTSPADVFAVGAEGAILSFDGERWTPIRSPAGALRGVWVLPSVVTFVGPDDEFHQLVRSP